MIKETIFNQKDHEFARYSADYELYQLGSYDDNKGMIESYPPAHILNLNQLKWEDPPVDGGATEKQLAEYDHEAELKAVQ